MKILITAPSLDVKKNVSGISAVVNTIIDNNPEVSYLHFLSGKKDNESAGFGRIVPLIKSYAHLYLISKQNKYQIIHLNLALNGKSLIRDYLVFKIARLFKKNIITHLHGGKYLIEKPESRLLKSIINDILKKSNQTLVLSDFEKDTLHKIYNPHTVSVLANTIEKKYLLTNRNKKDGAINFLFLGRLHESKGIQYIIEAFNAYTAAGYNGKLNICGTGPLEKYVLDNAALNTHITYHGIVSGKDKLEKIQQNDVFLLPSLHGEGLPIALLECMAVGLVPIVTTDGSMGQIVHDKQNGLLVKKADSAELAAKMKSLSNDPKLLETLSDNAKLYIKTNFDVDKYITKLNNIYDM